MSRGGWYSKDEIAALRSIFNLYDNDGTTSIALSDLFNIMRKLGYDEADGKATVESAQQFANEEGKIKFEDFLELLKEKERKEPGEQTDPKVIEFLRILEEYRLKCEEDGNYLEAARAYNQLETLRKQEEKRQQKAIRARQIAERQDVQVAHNMQYTDFNASWDRYMEEYDNMAQMYIQQMTERHAHNLLEFQRQLQKEVSDRPPKWSRELLEWRRRQHILARQKNYTQAQKIKKIADRLEQKEKKVMEQMQATVFARKEAKFRQQQQAELQALLKRIDCRRKEHIKQRNMDCKRLLQRNRNVQAVLESKQSVESVKLFSDIKKNLMLSTALAQATQNSASNGKVKKEKKVKKISPAPMQQVAMA